MSQYLDRPQNPSRSQQRSRSDNDMEKNWLSKSSFLQIRSPRPSHTRRLNSPRSRGQFIMQGDPNKKRPPCIHEEYNAEGSRMNVAAAPIELRMAIRINQVDHFKKMTQKPKGAVPPVSLPTWDQCPLDSKIPDFRNKSWPPGSLYFTRGKIGETMYRKSEQFDLSDPKGHKRPTFLEDYSSLHDPHTKGYFKRKGVVPLLLQNELINSKGEVLCNNKEFNQFRSYLSTIHNGGVNQRVQKDDSMKLFTTKLRKPFLQFKHREQFPNDYNEKLKKARQMQRDLVYAKSKRVDQKIKQWEQRIQMVERAKQEKHYFMVRQKPAEEYIASFRRDKKDLDEFVERKRLLAKTVYDIKRAAYNRNYDQLITRLLKDREEIDKVITLKLRDEQMLELKEVIDETIKVNKKKWISRYQKHIQYAQVNQENIAAAKQAKADRELWLQRKYFDIWREFVAKKIEARPTSGHKTNFKVEEDIRDMLDFLYEESGYDPREDFFARLAKHRDNIGGFVEREKRKSLERNKKWRHTTGFNDDSGHESSNEKRMKRNEGKRMSKSGPAKQPYSSYDE